MHLLDNVCYLKTVTDPGRLGDAVAEVAFVGRSNVGKSSLLNAVCGKKKLAHTSQVPGKTRTINVFSVAPGRWIVDLPGYGFAVGPADERAGWQHMIEGYLRERPSLRLVFVLVDAKVGATKLDRQMVTWLQANEIPLCVVANKSDRVAQPLLERRRGEIARDLGYAPEYVRMVSARKGSGIPELRQAVAEGLGLARPEK